VAKEQLLQENKPEIEKKIAWGIQLMDELFPADKR
jgi:hypothetical protein